ncbi:MAG: heavy metal-responsive transcriptional regulator [Plectolyngbya sp. WJT66-NPBG17]|jgi:DNA-binding transcriptional MerR regulator|nr:heavy metal-responsive transcriptional regulator [Plectolyngbya sp. WJT66-NPBG17]MBW4526296.1 heavy metal-responsive transcriptional regulator [Phormidium tanganyikae FI6-MK23]
MTLKIGEAAAKSGLPVKTIRYYDDIGLLTPTVERSQSGYRLFMPEVVDRLAFIKRAQSLGLSLVEVKEILAVHDRGLLPCEKVKEQIQDKVAQISEQIEQLNTLRTELQTVLSQWQEQPAAELLETTICPNLEVGMPNRNAEVLN